MTWLRKWFAARDWQEILGTVLGALLAALALIYLAPLLGYIVLVVTVLVLLISAIRFLIDTWRS